MAVYSVHLRGEGASNAAEAAFIRESFAWGAFFGGPFWLLQRRLWLAAVVWLIAFFILLTIASIGVLSLVATWTIVLLLEILFALEANHLLEVELARQGYRLVEIIAAPALDQAEVAFFRHLEPSEGAAAAPMEASTTHPDAAPPDSGSRR